MEGYLCLYLDDKIRQTDKEYWISQNFQKIKKNAFLANQRQSFFFLQPAEYKIEEVGFLFNFNFYSFLSNNF